MGPGPRGPGNLHVTVFTSGGSHCFNGAGTARSRKCLDAVTTLPSFQLLQWGRDRAVPEMGRVNAALWQAVGLQWGRDRAVPAICLQYGHGRRNGCASMGPGPRGPGNQLTTSDARSQNSLQWGRDRAVPEMPTQFLFNGTIVSFNGAGTARSRKSW